MGYLTKQQMDDLGLRVGHDVRISDDARIFGGGRVTIGDNVRVDAFCVLSAGATGRIEIGSHLHLASGVRLFGEGGITIDDFAGISAGSTLYSASDDYSGDVLMGPVIPEEFRSVDVRPIHVHQFAALGAHSLVFPGVDIGEGAVLAAGAMASRSLDEWTVYFGSPAKARMARRRGLIEQAEVFVRGWRPTDA